MQRSRGVISTLVLGEAEVYLVRMVHATCVYVRCNGTSGRNFHKRTPVEKTRERERRSGQARHYISRNASQWLHALGTSFVVSSVVDIRTIRYDTTQC